MLAYPVDLERDTNGTFLVTFPDLAEAVTFGEDEGDALLRAEDALEGVLAARIEDREDIPLPSPAAGRACSVLPALTAAKVLLYRAMREAGVRKADLARRLGWHGPADRSPARPRSCVAAGSDRGGIGSARQTPDRRPRGCSVAAASERARALLDLPA
jgi:antitoxin HicB